LGFLAEDGLAIFFKSVMFRRSLSSISPTRKDFLLHPADWTNTTNLEPAEGTSPPFGLIIRAHKRVKPFDSAGQVGLSKAVRKAAQAKEGLAGIINIAIEELVRQAFELPGFITIQEEVQRVRAEVNRAFHAQVSDSLVRMAVGGLIVRGQNRERRPELPPGTRSNRISAARHYASERTHKWLSDQQPPAGVFAGPPAAKTNQFEAEAKSLDAARIQELEPQKSYTLAAVLL
jgi:hypothetical protein